MKIDIVILKLGVWQELGFLSVNISQTSSIVQLLRLHVKYFQFMYKNYICEVQYCCELWAQGIFNIFLLLEYTDTCFLIVFLPVICNVKFCTPNIFQ